MDKGAIKRFAVTARGKLIQSVGQKAFELGVEIDTIEDAEVYEDGFLINGKFYKKYEITQREKLVREVKRKGYDQVIEEVAYTWFNRFIALRFMEVNDYLPTGIRIFSSIEEGKTEPDALTEVMMLVDELSLDLEKVYELQDANADEDLFKYILVKQCNKLGEIMPMMFEKIEDYTELLLPDHLLAEASIIHDMITLIDEEDWKREVEIIGWLYQYYISDKKDEVFADLRKNIKISKENIPAATELFTPRWIVQYMVDNSLGRLWLESHPDDFLLKKLPYYLDEAEQPEDVIAHLDSLKDTNLNPEMIKFFDPCMGSGHILVYAFEVFFEIYKSQGYREQVIPKLIIENNLYGLDIDPRAAQLAYFAMMMKARGYNSRLFNKELTVNVAWIDESNQLTTDDVELFIGDVETIRDDVHTLIDTFKDGKLFGSIIKVPEMDFKALKERVNDFKEIKQANMFEIDFKDHILPIIERLIKQAEILYKKYEVVVTNPPYMGRKGMGPDLTNYLRKNYKNSSADLFAVFMEVASHSVKENGFIGLINQHAWMFLSSYEKLRVSMLKNHQIYSMAHLGTRAFAEIGGEVVQTTTFVMRKKVIPNYIASFIRLTDAQNAEEKAEQFYKEELLYYQTQDGFSDIPGSPIAYWASKQIRKIFKESKGLGDLVKPRIGMRTGHNNRFLRYWSEIEFTKVGLEKKDAMEAMLSQKKWFPYNKGGNFRKWYGNQDFVVNWENDGQEIKDNTKLNYPQLGENLGWKISNEKFYFMSSITWSFVGSSNFGIRYSPSGFLFDVGGSSLFPEKKDLVILIGMLGSKVTFYFLKFLNPTMNFQVNDINSLPLVSFDEKRKNIESTVVENIDISKSDWDSFETSWDFKTHPFIEFKQDATTIAQAYSNWEQEAEQRFQTLKSNEEELNRIFIDLYGLQDELTPEVDDKEVTVSRADQGRDVKSFISYAVGLMLGRYSLDQEGLAFAGGSFDSSKYNIFKPDEDNVIPISDEMYFEDDIVTRFIDILKLIFGEESLEENLTFIADTLTRQTNETSRQRIRRYFLRDFYKDHVQIYIKHPIYWMFDSGRQNGFKALVYLHRYKSDLVSLVRTKYLHGQQKKYEEEMDRLDLMMSSDIPQREITRARKQKEKLQKQLLECQSYDQVIAHVAHQELELDLDDGVKVNYAKFQNVEVPQGEGKKPLKLNVLAKI